MRSRGLVAATQRVISYAGSALWQQALQQLKLQQQWLGPWNWGAVACCWMVKGSTRATGCLMCLGSNSSRLGRNGRFAYFMHVLPLKIWGNYCMPWTSNMILMDINWGYSQTLMGLHDDISGKFWTWGVTEKRLNAWCHAILLLGCTKGASSLRLAIYMGCTSMQLAIGRVGKWEAGCPECCKQYHGKLKVQ